MSISRVHPKRLPSLKYLSECFDYVKSTGALTWRVRPISHFPDERAWKIWNTRYSGTSVGSRRKNDYMHVKLLDSYWFLHRIIWKLVTGKDPGSMEVDHRNLIKTDNRWKNLRLASRMQNAANIPGSSSLGKNLHRSFGKIEARIIHDTKLYRKRFPLADIAGAQAWVRSMRKQLQGTFSRHDTV